MIGRRKTDLQTHKAEQWHTRKYRELVNPLLKHLKDTNESKRREKGSQMKDTFYPIESLQFTHAW